MQSLKPIEQGVVDLQSLNRAFDKVRGRVFTNKKTPYAGFYGSLLCGLDFVWSTEIATAATNGVKLFWNPYFFMRCSQELSETVLMHELYHVAGLHMLRRGKRDPKIWNYACDIRINNDLDRLGYSFHGSNPQMCHDVDRNGNLAEEDIYDLLVSNGTSIPEEHWGGDSSDLVMSDDPEAELSEEDKFKVITTVLTSVQHSELSNQGVPGTVKKTLEKFLSPVVNWEQVLYQFFSDLSSQDYSWRRPSRRSIDTYLPSVQDEHEGLEHILYVEDVSGSISEADLVRFNSELKYVWDRFQPEKMTIIQFDTEIQSERTLEKGEELTYIEHCGGGGTSLRPVRDWIIKNKPTAAVIFSDLLCNPIDPTGIDCPVIWIAIRNREAVVPIGKLIHIRK